MSRDSDAICRIYNPHVLNSIVTFEETEVAPDEMAERIASVSAMFPWLVADEAGLVVGYAYAVKHRERSAYRHAVESTIYIAEGAKGRGLGLTLYSALLERLRGLPLHTALGGIALPNAASVALHEKCGFKKVAHFSEVGFKLGRWIDVSYWQIVW